MRIFVLTLLVTLAISACGILGTKYPEMHGRVLHEIHDKPIPDTIVVALWKGLEGTGDGAKTVCYHVEQTETDDKGYFTIPNWREPSSYDHLKDRKIYAYAFHKHYRTSELSKQIITDKNYIYYLAKPRQVDDENKARENRLRYLQQLVGDTTCDLEGDSRVNLKPMYSAIVEEAEQLVVTEKDRLIVQQLKSWLAFVTPPEEK